MMDANKIYEKKYYDEYIGDGRGYERTDPVWTAFFGNIADRIIAEIHPKTVLDVGCANGFLVEALRDRGVEAYGIDISEYAISEVRDDIKPYCRVKSADDELEHDYDLIVTIEMFEHLETETLLKACKNLCRHADTIIFSSTPFDYNDETHLNVKPVEYWTELFRKNGFLHDIEYDASYISLQAMKFDKKDKDIDTLLREYERMLFRYKQEITPLRDHLALANERIRVMDENNVKWMQEREKLISKLEIAAEELAVAGESNIALRDRVSEATGKCDAMENSKSWKLTKPLRMADMLVRNQKHK